MRVSVADGASSPRARRLWRTQAAGLTHGPVFDGRGRVYVFDPSSLVPFALDVNTGERLWTGEADPGISRPKEPSEPEDPILRGLPRYLSRRAQRSTGFHEHIELALSQSALLVRFNDRLTAYAMTDGHRLWSHPEACRLLGARAGYVLLQCDQRSASYVVASAADGKKVIAVHDQGWDSQAVLVRDFLVVTSEETERVQGYPLSRAGVGWKVKVPGGNPRETRRIRLGGPLSLLASNDVVIRAGDSICALDAQTGRRLWQRPGQDVSDVLAAGDELWLVTGARLSVVESRTGRMSKEYQLPGSVLGSKLAAVGERIVFAGAAGTVDSNAVMVTWTRQAPRPQILRRPGGASDVVAAGPVLLAYSAFDGVLAAFDPNLTEPPLARLPAEAAIAALLDELGPADRLLDPALSEIPGLGHYFAEVARKPDHPLYDSALLYLGRQPVPEALPVLLDRMGQATDPDERYLLRAALAKQDDRKATEALLAEAKMVTATSDPLHWWRSRSASADLNEQVWRTGQSTEMGLCPKAGTHTMSAPAEAPKENEIGTSHPLIFQEVAADGSWVSVCQARADTNRDGKIEIHFGHHGDSYGDQLHPYLVIGSGPGVAVDEVLAADSTGHHVAVREGVCLSLIDTRTRAVTLLPNADLRDADAVFGPPRAVSFDAEGSRMLYLRGGVPHNVLIVRELASGKETKIDPGTVNLWRASLDASGGWIVLETIDGPEWPTMNTTLSSRICRGPPASYGIYGSRGMDRVVKRVISSAGGQAQSVAGFIRPFGVNLLVRTDDGALVEVNASGARLRTLVPADCGALLLHADAERGLLLVACLSEENVEKRLRLFGNGAETILAPEMKTKELALPELDTWQPGRPRFVSVADSLTVDLDSKSVVETPVLAPSEVRATTRWEDRLQGIYARRGDGAVLSGPPANRGAMGAATGPLRWLRPLKP